MKSNTDSNNYYAIDVYAGCGGLSEGMRRAGFHVVAAIEKDEIAARCYKKNHSKTDLIIDDIRKVRISNIEKLLADRPLHLLAGCPPCQGFSSIRRLNRQKAIRDDRNGLILEYLRLIKKLKPLTIMMENVPGLINYYLFKDVIKELENLGYRPKTEIVNVKDYGVPQSRKRLIMVGSLLGEIDIAERTVKKVTVKDAIGKLEPIWETKDPLHRITAQHTPKVMERIRLTPKDGGSWKDLPENYVLKCHKKENVGFKDIYGRLRWNDYSSTITGGCLNPSKGRFLHPEEDRVITAREAALLQSFRRSYRFPVNIPKAALALLIGNALPPRFSYIQSQNIKKHLDKYLG
ncbi:MAG: DNA cytosine methyltransferase [Nitrospirae bacterium]|nr:DNA cytosine methyltransferase [Nitrospirota bacterium]MCL5978824.1 DNA cytosine methyltransferase [Nitrospirota bacterium]